MNSRLLSPANRARIIILGVATALNLPFGAYRKGTEKFSVAWFLAIHAPVPFVIWLRRSFPVLTLRSALPLSLSGALMGQLIGGRAIEFYHDDAQTRYETSQRVADGIA